MIFDNASGINKIKDNILTYSKINALYDQFSLASLFNGMPKPSF